MTCPSEWMFSMLADGELTGNAAAEVTAHLSGCPGCRSRLAALRAEAQAIVTALSRDPESVAVPAFRQERTAPVRPLAVLAGWFVLAAVLVAAARAAVDISWPAPLAWLDPFEEGALADFAVRLFVYLARHGDTIMTSIRDTAATATVLAFLGWSTVAVRRYINGPLLISALACAALALPAPSHALDIRRGDHGIVHVGADETIADTLVAVGENVEIDGNVDGDLIAFGRLVTIRGRVGGEVITAGRHVTIDGEVSGSILSAGETVDVTAPKAGRNLYAAGNTVSISERTAIAQNVVAAGQRVILSGPVDRDVVGLGEDVEVGSTIGGSVTAYADRVTVLAPARVGGDLVAHVPDDDRLTVSPGAHIAGTVTTKLREGNVPIASLTHARENRYTRGGFYVSQVLQYAAAFVMGVILLALVPDLRRIALHDIGNTLVAGGIGLVTLVAVPVIAVLAVITIIGIPIAVVGLLLWAVGLYFAKIVLGHFIGARVLEGTGSADHFAVALAVGLVIVLIAVNLPFIGFVLNFLLTICGLGLLVLFLWDALRGDAGASAAA